MWLAFAVGAKLAADRDDARSDREFLQIQRIQLYGEVLAPVDTTVALMTDYFPTGDKVDTPYSELPNPNPEQYNEIDEADSRLNTLYGRVPVLSSADLARKAQILLVQTGSSTATYGSSESVKGAWIPVRTVEEHSKVPGSTIAPNEPWTSVEQYAKRQNFCWRYATS